ncbi:hypothetical protein FZI86_22670 [Mycobacterium sp. CBMA335]|nr:hypothetical protein [Mycolicibacterium sp. CBMA 213]MUL61036.1 hypothetical protein [Mycolicibacterium sp. CBMA 335]
MFTAAVSVVVQTPVMIADAATTWLFGQIDPQSPNDAPPEGFCLPIPSPAEATTEGADSSAPPTQVPMSILGPDGKPSPDAMNIISQVPVGADIDIATAWMLYRFAHPQDARMADFEAFADAYTSTRSSMSSGAGPLEVDATIDPVANYSPYLLVAQAASYRLLRQGSLSSTTQQTHDLIGAIGTTCAGNKVADAK